MKILNQNDSLLLIIDIQEKLINSVFNKEQLEQKAIILAKSASILDIPIIVTEQYPKGLGATITSLKSALSPNTRFFEKTAFSALDNNEILNKIKEFNKKQIIVFGIETHICVNQTINALINNNYDVFLVKDASGSRCEFEHNAGIDKIKSYGANITTTEISLFEWLKSSKHNNFKEIQALIK